MSLVWTDLETEGLDPAKCTVLEVAVVVTDDDFNEITSGQWVVYNPLAARIVELLDQRVHYRYRSVGDLVATEHEKPNYGRLHVRDARLAHIDPFVLEMHDKNGLWRDCIKGLALDTVDREIAALVDKYAVRTEEETVEVKDEARRATMVANGLEPVEKKTKVITPQLAGSTISFDRAFIGKYMPRFADEKRLHYRNLDVSSFNEMAKRDAALKFVYDKRPRNETKAHRGLADILESIAGAKHYRNAFSRAVAAFAVSGAIDGLVAP